MTDEYSANLVQNGALREEQARVRNGEALRPKVGVVLARGGIVLTRRATNVGVGHISHGTHEVVVRDLAGGVGGGARAVGELTQGGDGAEDEYGCGDGGFEMLVCHTG